MSTKARAEARQAARGKGPIPQVVIPDVVPDDLRDDVGWALGFKNFSVDSNTFGTGDTPPIMSIYRDGALLLHAWAPQVDRDLGLWFMDRAIGGYSADAATMFTDAHMMDERFVDEKGRMPDPHEMQHLCDNEGACDLGLTTDCIFGMHITRAEPDIARYVSFPYHVNQRTRRVHWQPDVIVMDEHDADVKMEGRIAEALRQFMKADHPHTQEFEQLGDPVHTRFMMDMYLTSMFTMMGYAVAWLPKSEQERELVAETLANLGANAGGKEPTKAASPTMQYLATKTRMQLDDARRRNRETELAEAARRQRERGEEPAQWTQPGDTKA